MLHFTLKPFNTENKITCYSGPRAKVNQLLRATVMMMNIWVILGCVTAFVCFANECDVEIERDNLCTDIPKDPRDYCVVITGKTLIMKCINKNIKVSVNT